jgi:hypothetical protein
MQREIGIIIRVKDAAKAKQEIKDIVDTKLLGSAKAATKEFKQMGDEVKRSGTNAKVATSQFDSMFNRMAKGAGILYTLRRGLNAAFGSFEAGAGLERAAVQFESSIGKINEFLPQLRSATRGTVNDMRLLETANRSVMEGLNPKNLTKMYQMATVASRKLGLESEQAIQTISNAIVRQDESALTTLGTILKTNIGLKVQTAIMSKNAGVMSGAAAIAIRQSVIMSELNKRFGGFNQLQEDGIELIQQFRAAMSNLRMSIGPIIGIVMGPALKALSGIANGLSTLLTQLKDSPSFQTAARNIGAVLAVLAAAKTVALVMSLAKAVGIFSLGIKGLAVAAGGLAVLKILGMETNDLSVGFSKLSTAAQVFFQLIGNYDDATGMSKVLDKDKQALGGLYNAVFTAAKIWKVFEAAGRGALNGVKLLLDIVAPVLGSFGGALQSVLNSFINGEPLLQSALDKIERGFKLLTAAALPVFIGKMLLATTAVKGLALGVSTFFGLAKGVGIVSALAAAFKVLAVAAIAAMSAMGPVGWAMLAGGAALGIGAGVAALSSADSSSSSMNQTSASPSPDMREQNVQAASRGEFDQQMLKYMSALPKLVDIQERQDQREEQRDVQQRVSPAGGNIYRR